MRITAISQQLKQKDRYSVFVDNKYVFSLRAAAVLDSHITVGQELSKKDLDQLQHLAIEDKLYTSVLNFATFRLRSRWEICSYLERKKIDSKLTETILNKLSKLDLINDKEFARMWVDNRYRLKHASQLKIRQELRQKHVDSAIIDELLSDYNESAVLETLIDSLKRRSKFKDNKVKLMQYLCRQGFNYNDIKKILVDHN